MTGDRSFESSTVLLAVSHGTSSPIGQAAVRALVEAVRTARVPSDIRDGFVDVQRPNIDDLLDGLGSERRAVAVPLLLSAGYHVHVDLAEALAPTQGRVVLADALGPDDRLVTVLARRLQESGVRDSDVIVLAAAGSSDARAVDDCREVGRRLASALDREVVVGFLSAAEPRLPDAVVGARASAARASGARVVVSSYLLAPGYFQDLVEASGADVVTSPLLLPDDTPPELTDIVFDRYASAALTLPGP